MRMSVATMSDFEKPTTSALEDATHSPPGSMTGEDTEHVSPRAYSVEMENRVLRKMDLYLIPMLAVLYLLAFLDRGNIGNAKIEGLLDDLHMTGQEYNWCCMLQASHWRCPGVNSSTNQRQVTVFFFTYCAFELPTNLLLKKLRPSRLLPLLMIAWGIVMVEARRSVYP
jgi:hypothetical protein